MDNNKLTMFLEKFEIDGREGQFDGVTVLIDGVIKQMLDIIITNENLEGGYEDAMQLVLFAGIETFVKKYNNQ